MTGSFPHEPMLDMYIFETTQLVEQLEQLIIACDNENLYDASSINEVFRIMHTIKGSSAMMLFNEVSGLAHSIEDVFFYLREYSVKDVNCARLSDLILASIDFIKSELQKISAHKDADGTTDKLIAEIKDYLQVLRNGHPGFEAEVERESPVPHKPERYYISQNKADIDAKGCYKATVFFEEDCGMENLRAYTTVHGLKELADEVFFEPEDIIENDDTAQFIRNEGFKIIFSSTRSYSELENYLQQTIFLRKLEFMVADAAEFDKMQASKTTGPANVKEIMLSPGKVTEGELPVGASQSMISVSVVKLDKLMDLVGELVIAEAMVTQNPDLRGLALDNFVKAARQLKKITGELQDSVMSIRMVSLSATFQKMHRIVRDMCKKLDKEVKLELAGETTEVDKNIIEKISDPLMHIIRNAIDHGIEAKGERLGLGKPAFGTITLEAKNAGGDVLIIVRDDGRGLNRDKLIHRARENNLIYKPENELTDKEIFSFIFHPGFSTKESVTEFSGRGVGMDVVMKNINAVGGSVLINSSPGKGTEIILKIPLTLAIIDGMTVGVGKSSYTIPIASLRESFRPRAADMIRDPDGNEMLMVRGQCYPLIRLHKLYKVKAATTTIADGIVIMAEHDSNAICLLADRLIGEQQVVVKSLPKYIKEIGNIAGIAGCTLLGDGNISLIIDLAGLIGVHK